MIKDRKRKEITLDKKTLDILTIQAKAEGRSLKNYMEHVLRMNASRNQNLSQEYKDMMDGLLRDDTAGTINYLTEDEFRARSSK